MRGDVSQQGTLRVRANANAARRSEAAATPHENRSDAFRIHGDGLHFEKEEWAVFVGGSACGSGRRWNANPSNTG